MAEYVQVLVSAATREEANKFSDMLVKERLVAGCMIKEGACRYWWNGEIVEKVYWNVEAFTVALNKNAIVAAIEGIASDDCPIVAFFELDGNRKFLTWLSESVEKR